MKQQEILRKIGNILKELNEQYEYLQAEEMHQNDLELELFAANAKFLTDHTEILRKINIQLHDAKLSLPEHTDDHATLLLEPVTTEDNEIPQANVFELPENTPLPPLSETAINYHLNSEEDEQVRPDVTETFTEANTESAWQQLPEEDNNHHHDVVIEHTQDTYGFFRHEPEVSSEQHSFSLSSSHTEEEPTPVHVDVTEPAAPLFEAPAAETEPAYTPEIQQPDEEEPQPPAEPVEEPTAPAPVEEPTPQLATTQQHAFEPIAQEPVTTYAPPVFEQAKLEPEQPLTLNERLSAQLNGSKQAATGALHAQSVTDIKSAINLNDKMLFVKDLFNGYSLAYSEAIELLNRCKTFDEADRFLKSNYVAKNNWADKPDTVDKFYAILQRRFAS
ncbi:hypothetical protein ABDD95_05160 [Mucilaginibacter sp. PAMB04274]|uniref:hypothetical protein n=1 Tax=Mucilaginibacter sp. PAMB04274 TaxID=3138568 RepID=UPI0031F7061D